MSDKSLLKPRYEQMYLAIRERISSGKYANGERIPSEKELMEEFDVSRITSKKALDMLVNDGVIMRQPGRGSFVTAPDENRPARREEGTTAGGRSERIVLGLIMEDFSDSYGKEMLAEMERTAQQKGVYLLLRLSFSEPDIEEKAIMDLREYGVNGLIIYPTRGKHFSPEILKLVIENFPHVLVDRYLKGTATTAISTDNVEAARLGIAHLFELGHRHIGVLASKVTDNVAIEDRLEGIMRAYAEQGVVLDRSYWLTDMRWLNGEDEETVNKLIGRNVDRVQRFLLDNPQITALFALEYDLALISKEAVEKLGKKVARDISIICFDSPVPNAALYPFTHIQQDQIQLGKLAVNSVLDLIGGETLPSKISLDARLVTGASTGPVVPALSSNEVANVSE